MVTVKCDNLEAKAKKLNKALKRASKGILQNATMKGAETASRYSPPKNGGSWSRTIPAKSYKRPVFHIITALKQKTFKKYAKLLREKLAAGFKFVVFKQVRGREKVWFTKTEREAKSKYGRIKYRGFIKIMYGLNLIQKGVESGLFQKLLRKSPDLAKVPEYSKSEWNEKENICSLTIKNLAGSGSLAKVAKTKAVPVIKRFLKKSYKNFNAEYTANGRLK